MKTESSLNRFRDQVVETLGDRLVGLILHGSCVTSEGCVAPDIPINVLIIVRSINLKTLTELAPVVRKGQRAMTLVPMMLSEKELHTSTDVFPITFMEMRRSHRLLAGKDVLESLTISHAHLRLRCEQELKTLLLRLQRAFLQQGHKPRLLRRTLVTGMGTFLKSMRAGRFSLMRTHQTTSLNLWRRLGSVSTLART